MRGKIVPLQIALCLVSHAGLVAAELPPREFVFARTEIGDWTVRAVTKLVWQSDQGGSFPRVEDVNCYGQSEDADLNINSFNRMNLLIRFRGPNEDGELGEITLTGDHLWLYIDGERWEFANIEQPSSNFLNVTYPESKDENQIIIPIWRGFEAVRRSKSDTWSHFDLLHEKLLSAKNLYWGFKSRDWTVVDRAENELPKNWQRARYRIDNSDWRKVESWCSRQIASETARTLPNDLLKTVRK